MHHLCPFAKTLYYLVSKSSVYITYSLMKLHLFCCWPLCYHLRMIVMNVTLLSCYFLLRAIISVGLISPIWVQYSFVVNCLTLNVMTSGTIQEDVTSGLNIWYTFGQSVVMITIGCSHTGYKVLCVVRYSFHIDDGCQDIAVLTVYNPPHSQYLLPVTKSHITV